MSNSSAAAGAFNQRPSDAEVISQPDLLEQLRNDVNSSNLMDSQALESSPEPQQRVLAVTAFDQNEDDFDHEGAYFDENMDNEDSANEDRPDFGLT